MTLYGASTANPRRRSSSASRGRRVSAYTSSAANPIVTEHSYASELKRQNKLLRRMVQKERLTWQLLLATFGILWWLGQVTIPLLDTATPLEQVVCGSPPKLEARLPSLVPNVFREGRLRPQETSLALYQQLPPPFPEGFTPAHFAFIFKDPYEVFNLNKNYTYTAIWDDQPVDVDWDLRAWDEQVTGPAMTLEKRRELLGYLQQPWNASHAYCGESIDPDFCPTAKSAFQRALDSISKGHAKHHVPGPGLWDKVGVKVPTWVPFQKKTKASNEL